MDAAEEQQVTRQMDDHDANKRTCDVSERDLQDSIDKTGQGAEGRFCKNKCDNRKKQNDDTCGNENLKRIFHKGRHTFGHLDRDISILKKANGFGDQKADQDGHKKPLPT